MNKYILGGILALLTTSLHSAQSQIEESGCVVYLESNLAVLNFETGCYWAMNKIVYEHNFEVKNCGTLKEGGGFYYDNYCVLGPK